MAITEIPPVPTEQNEPAVDSVPQLVVELQDELTWARLREACWISLIFHLFLVIALVTSPKWAPAIFSSPIPVNSAEDLLQDKELTYLDMPQDRQRVDKAPRTDKMSDKNRIATTTHPLLDKKAMDQLRDLRRPGPPTTAGSPSLPPQPSAQAQSASPAPSAATHAEPQTQARLEPPPVTSKSVFGSAMSPGQAIEQAARAASAGRASGHGMSGASGDYGLGHGSPAKAQMGPLDILSDTMGVDFGPYMSRVLQDVRRNWYSVLPPSVNAPIFKKGKVGIEFAIMKDGSVRGLQVVNGSGDTALDRAAYGGITLSNPFPPLPKEFSGPYLALRFRFYYNPDEGEVK
jgi:TonB family protein